MFKVKIVTPEGEYGQFDVIILNLRTTNGQIGLLTDHMSYLANLEEGELNFIENNQRRTFKTGAGLVFFDNNLATVLLDEIAEIEVFNNTEIH